MLESRKLNVILLVMNVKNTLHFRKLVRLTAKTGKNKINLQWMASFLRAPRHFLVKFVLSQNPGCLLAPGSVENSLYYLYRSFACSSRSLNILWACTPIDWPMELEQTNSLIPYTDDDDDDNDESIFYNLF